MPHAAVRTKQARAALPAEVPMGDAVFNVAHAALLDARPRARATGTSSRPGSTTACTSRAASTSTRGRWSWSGRRRGLGALGATISGAGPTVLLWCHYEQTGAVVEAVRGAAEGWADVLHAPFESQGADVRAL